jgi:hypothetical protein
VPANLDFLLIIWLQIVLHLKTIKYAGRFALKIKLPKYALKFENMYTSNIKNVNKKFKEVFTNDFCCGGI